MVTTEFYRTGPIKRERRTKKDINAIGNHLSEVLNEYHPMTVRQVFYQMTSRGYVPKTEKSYKGVICRLLRDLRLDGTIPFGWISDNTRWMRKPKTYDSMEQSLELTLETYRRALWTRMPANVEIWIEKDALAGVLIDVTSTWDVPLMVTKGYSSITYLYDAAKEYEATGKPTYVYYLGDYDPSGMDIARSVEKRLRQFAATCELHFERVAVTEDHIRRWNLPTRPTKKTDTRAKSFGSAESVELDAIPPSELRALVENCIIQHINPDEYENLLRAEKAEKESLEWVIRAMRSNA